MVRQSIVDLHTADSSCISIVEHISHHRWPYNYIKMAALQIQSVRILVFAFAVSMANLTARVFRIFILSCFAI